jgi:hypothetical protein
MGLEEVFLHLCQIDSATRGTVFLLHVLLLGGNIGTRRWVWRRCFFTCARQTRPPTRSGTSSTLTGTAALEGQCHEIVIEMSPWRSSLGPN